MEYEYEDKVVNVLKTFGVLYNSNINFRMAEEVEDVYRKAKAFDKLVKLYPQKEEIPSDEFFDEMGYIVEEDK